MATLQDIQFHYDTGNDLFTLFLDHEHKMYSCAVWQDCNTLEAAQAKKLDRIATFAKVKPGDRVLDVGCGWGGMLLYLLDKFKVKKPTGLTLSQEQFNFIKSLLRKLILKFVRGQIFTKAKLLMPLYRLGHLSILHRLIIRQTKPILMFTETFLNVVAIYLEKDQA